MQQELEEKCRVAQAAQRKADARAAKAEAELQRFQKEMPGQIEAEVSAQVDQKLALAERDLYKKQEAFFKKLLFRKKMLF